MLKLILHIIFQVFVLDVLYFPALEMIPYEVIAQSGDWVNIDEQGNVLYLDEEMLEKF